MKSSWQESIPERLHAPVRAALSAVLGNVPLDEVAAVPGGASGAATLRIVANGHSYLLRVEVNHSVMRNPHQYACLRIAAATGIAPRLYHADDGAGIAITDFIQQRPLEHYPGGPLRLASALGTMVQSLQATAPFPPLLDQRIFVGQTLNHLETLFTPGLLARHREGFERLRAALPWDSTTHVSSHNDPNPRNILFDGERLWLIDWETAYRNDPLLDLAILAESHAPSAELRDALLHAWRNRPPDRPTLARLQLMRLLSRLYYAGLLIGASGARTGAIADTAALSPEEFREKIIRGELAPTASPTLLVLGKMYLAGFLLGIDAPDFEESLVMAG